MTGAALSIAAAATLSLPLLIAGILCAAPGGFASFALWSLAHGRSDFRREAWYEAVEEDGV
jgi:hypothetical protein